MSAKGVTTKALAKKLSEKSRVVQAVKVQDIEDAVKSPYFSPVQTRQQRKNTKSQPKRSEALVKSEKSTSTSANSKPIKVNALTNNNELQSVNIKEDVNERKDIHLDSNEANTKTESQDKWEPQNWRLILENIRAMRADAAAPVDTMGCHKCSDNEADEKTQRFQKLVALMLSSQTKDEITYEAMQRLKSSGLTPQAIIEIETGKLEELLKPVSFYKNKAKYLQLASRMLVEKYDSDIPGTSKELQTLPGVGPKMAHICMATAWNQVTGIGVDVHVHRIVNRLRWLPKPTKEPEQTRVELESWLPRDMWQDVNHLLVGFGQTVCKAVRPHCSECLNREICPASTYKSTTKTKIKSESANIAAKISKLENP
ncbi:endonuclease III-like protein 1 [Bactrocera neohumeralis]|uniref:endonuclease III-like protein 1 n=1 Tax=Bactrocera neohumeralis TaxID=98809 RepID=UPI0021652A00|nr:endonuclease III-like protein 1 [Bactrocera neohumeralis]